MTNSDRDMKFGTWEEAARWAAEELANLVDLGTPHDSPDYYVNIVDAELGDPKPSWITLAWRAARGYLAFTGLLDLDVDALVNLLASKQHDYGHDNILRYGVDGIKVRVSDKVCRLRNLLSRSGDDGASGAMNEAIEDSFLDIVGYAVIAIMLEHHVFELPLAADANRALTAAEEDLLAEVERELEWEYADLITLTFPDGTKRDYGLLP